VSESRHKRMAIIGTRYGSGVAERLRSCTASGILRAANAVGQAGSAACGGMIRIELAVSSGAIDDASYQAYGCPATIASASEVTARVRGKSVLAAASMTRHEVCEALGLVADKEASADLALEALHVALGEAVAVGAGFPATAQQMDESGVLVGMSGGVDSAVAALLLREEGYRVVGLTLKLWTDPASSGERGCCSAETVRRARRVAHDLGIPHLTVGAGDLFHSRVVEYFVGEYAGGRTPNPCAKCNARVRFGLMLDIAHRLGLARIGTGHYARLMGEPPGLARGIDTGKDQSYVLAEVAPDILGQAMFPLGGMRKAQVRALAAQAGLEGHSVPESQEICFVPNDDHRRFLRERLGERPGAIVDAAGRELGRHLGTYNFTIGQRKGLGIATARPLLVTGLFAERCQVTVGDAVEAAVGRVSLTGITRHHADAERACTAQLRSSGGRVPAHMANGATVDLEEPVVGVAPGQTAVLYEGEKVVLAGTIQSTERWAGPQSLLERGEMGPVV